MDVYTLELLWSECLLAGPLTLPGSESADTRDVPLDCVLARPWGGISKVRITMLTVGKFIVRNAIAVAVFLSHEKAVRSFGSHSRRDSSYPGC
jgi:hypothetical protein